MISSMTGFGRNEQMVSGRDIIVEIKSVNHRFFDFSARITHGYGFLEEKLKTSLQNTISRGKIDIFVSIDSLNNDNKILVNHSIAQGYLAALRELQQRYGLQDDISVTSLARYPDIFTVRKAAEDENEIWSAVEMVLKGALESFLAMRKTEGARMKEDVVLHGKNVLALVERVEERSPQTVEEYRARLQERLKQLLGEADLDLQRVMNEAAVYADKVSVAEETVRIRSHIAQFFKMIETGGAVGRKLDFIVQEMNREANTIGSKCVDAEIAHMVVDIKAELEKIREQIQNIE